MPNVMILLSFILLVLFITGIIATAIQLFGPDGNINGECQRYVNNNRPFGPTVNTLAWLQQKNICELAESVARDRGDYGLTVDCR